MASPPPGPPPGILKAGWLAKHRTTRPAGARPASCAAPSLPLLLLVLLLVVAVPLLLLLLVLPASTAAPPFPRLPPPSPPPCQWPLCC